VPAQCSKDSDCEGLGFHGWRCDTGAVCIEAGQADAAVSVREGGEFEASSSSGSDADAVSGLESGAGDADAGAVSGLESGARDADADAVSGLESGVRDANTLDGPVTAQGLYCGLTAPRGITLFNGQICWVGDLKPQGLFCAPVSGGTPASIVRIDDRVIDAPFLLDAFDLLLDATYVYWSNGQNNQAIRMQRGGRPQQYFTGGGRVSFLAFGNAATVWATDFADPPSSGAGEIIVGPSGAGTASNAIYTAEVGASGVAVYRGNVYWGNSSGLNFGPLAGNARINRIMSPERPVGGVAVDAQGTAYFLAGNRSLYRYATGAAAPTFMYAETSAFGTGDVAVDDQSVYFSEPDRGCIMIIQK